MTFLLGPALLFVPADRPERYSKAMERADAVIIDLEDAVASSARPKARAAIIGTPLDPDLTIVRVNPVGTRDHTADLAALAETGYRTIMLPKAESPEHLSGLDGFAVIALCESAVGVLAAPAIARANNVVALMWGAEDLVASLGGTASRNIDGSYRPLALHARSRVLLAAGAAGVAAIDTVHLDMVDLDGLALEAEDAVASGFAATACIHPGQVETIRAAYRPSDAESTNARAILAAAASNPGVFRFEGMMIDGPVLRHAEAVLRRAR